MRTRIFALSLLATTVLGSAAAFAGPTIQTIPMPSYSDGFLDIVFNDHETLVTGVGQQLQGTGIVTSITGGGNTTYGNSKTVTNTGQNGIAGTYGPGPKVLTDVFTGFTLRTTTVSAGQTTLYFTGGQLNLYVSKNSQLIPNTTGVSPATAEFNAGLGNAGPNPAQPYLLWLQLTPEQQDSFHDTFITTINTTTLSNFTLAQGVAYLDATGGIAQSYFDTNSVTNSYLNQVADLQFGGRAGVKCTPNGTTCQLPVGGSDDAFNIFAPVPEPMTLSLFGAGVAGFAALRRKKAKKA
jgi:hypothetical protein